MARLLLKRKTSTTIYCLLILCSRKL